MRRILLLLLLTLGVLSAPMVRALTPDEATAIASGETDDRIAALNQAAAQADPALAVLLQALLDDAVKVAGGKAYVTLDGKTKEGQAAATSATHVQGP